MLVAHHNSNSNSTKHQFNNNNNNNKNKNNLDNPRFSQSIAAQNKLRLDDNIAFNDLRLTSSHSSTLSSNFLDATAADAAAQDPVLVAGLDSDIEFDQDFDLSMLGGNDLMMQSDHWLPANHLAAGRSFGHPNIAHHRESSLSSLGSASAGPASPFSQSTSNPHIAVNDSVGDSFSNMSSYYEEPSFPLVKQANATGMTDGLYSQGHAAYTSDGLPMPHGAYGSLLAANRQRAGVTSSHSERGLQPPPDLSMSSNRSQPVSVASSIASNSPATPSLDQAEEDARRRNGEIQTGSPPVTSAAEEDFLFLFDGDGEDENDECSRFFNDIVAYHAPPKLDRTMTDVYGDELYSPNFAAMPTSAPSANTSHMAPSNQEMFAQRLQQINNQHLSAASHQSPLSAGTPRERSPFRHGSPMAPAASHDFGASAAANNLRYGPTATQQQQRGLASQDAFRAQIARSQGTSTPQTISPKDAVLDYRDPDGEGDGSAYSSLFAQGGQQGFSVDQMNKTVPHMGQNYHPNIAGGVSATSNYGYVAPQLNQGLQLTQQYPFMAQQQHGGSSMTGHVSATHSPAPAIRPVASLAELSEPVPGSQRPGIAVNDGGTYTCTYHGCTQRFETPALLQKHKREGHRQANALAGARRPDNASSPQSLLNSQAGPHRCERINPSTGKPCNTIFSRPYDLTRHEDTIHNGRKQKVRCNLCTEEKTFSRADALTRHFRVCHPEVEFTGKHRKRGVHTS
ncbi:hypothetical protein SCUCBS95973_006836 [Sporothrix curviconia]|uniref:C2H2-type domain-containing protein n=1 Tax=Sporothrix curviconia TaxID=1260050 RepID=A0ABP0C8F9_9PEZI